MTMVVILTGFVVIVLELALEQRRYTRDLDRIGIDYDLTRHPRESNRHFAMRIRNRSIIRGLK